MNSMLIALTRVAESIKANRKFLSECRWYQSGKKHQLVGAYVMLMSVYGMLTDLALEEIHHKDHHGH